MESKRDRLTEVYSDYYPAIFSAVYTKVGNREDTRDICQEIFTRLYERLEEVENVRRWLFSALRLVVLEHFRAKRKNDGLNIDDIFNDVGLTFVNGFRDTRIIINDAIENTENFRDERERILFDLIAVNNFTYKQVAKQLGLTRRQVEYRYGQIVERVLRYLEKKGISNIEELL